jgi:dipeptidyl-peptidase-3
MKKILALSTLLISFAACRSDKNELAQEEPHKDTLVKQEISFNYVSEQFTDLRVLRYEVKGFDELDLKTKTLLYYLYEAALSGRDIIYDQNYKNNLLIRKTLEALLNTESHDQASEEFKKIEVYAKRVWFSNGIHHHYAHDKFFPECSQDFFMHTLEHVDENLLPKATNQSKVDFIKNIADLIYNPKIAPKRVSKDASSDMILASSVNFYEGVTEKEVTQFYESQVNKNSKQQPMYGLNSKVIKENGKLAEKKWKIGGMYTSAIEKIVFWLEKASSVAENEAQKKSIDALITFYKSGSLEDFDKYNIAWVNDTASTVDVVNGFIEVYLDPLGKKGSFESVVSIKDFEASKRIATIGANAQWFEDNSPILPQHKKKNVKGISAKVINAVVESGDSGPVTPIGINLPNNEWIREQHGSKSVNLGNIVEAKEHAAGGSVANEFYSSQEIKDLVIHYAGLADKLHTDMHEVIGHASGRIEDGKGQPHETLKNYASALEEGRADLVALYYLMDPKLVELGVMPSLEYGKAAYQEYITNGLIIQLARINLNKNIEEDHMRNRKMIAAWCYEKGAKENVIEKKMIEGKTYFIVNDYTKLRNLFGELLRELQRIKSQGDYIAGKNLIENYGVKIDLALHKEILDRYSKLNIAPYTGFIQPKLIPILEGEKIMDVKIMYPEDFKTQMLNYGKEYAFLPISN